MLWASGGAGAATSWSSFSPREDHGSECLRVGAQKIDYFLLEPDRPVTLRLRGPRKLKVVARYLFGDADTNQSSFEIALRVDGKEELRKTFRAGGLPGVGVCGKDLEVSALRRATLSIPTGLHDVQVFAGTEGSGRVAARFFRNSRGRKVKMVNFSPERYESVYRLQFDSGRQSTYYHFSDAHPLRFSIQGPSSLEIDSRLDFDQTMRGSTSYRLELLQDGEPLQRFIYHTKKISSAAYVERKDILPGERKRMKLPVPRGAHEYEIRCLGPQACGVALRIRIPETDLQGK